jgi:hypothetical protein
MSAGYRFFSWSREGLAAGVPAGAQGTEGGRAVLPITLGVTKSGQSDSVAVKLLLYGPGDVLGIDIRQIIRRDPPPLTAQFEPNYFPAVEFDLPDYPWLFSPEASSPKLRPWIVLAVVRKDAAALKTDPGRPLPWLEIDPANILRELPPLADSWAWAHAQVAGNGTTGTIDAPPEQTLSRLVCPRRLESGVSYLACIVPAYEAGRQAGLGLEVTAAGEDAWPPPGGGSGAFELPVYDHWEFSTGPDGDFEALARRLQPVAFGPEIGTRPMDLTTAGWQLPVPPAGEPGSQLGFEGALMSPVAVPTEWPDDAREPFMQRMVELIDEVGESQIVKPPLYGSNAVVPPPSSTGAAGWLWQLNLDPATGPPPDSVLRWSLSSKSSWWPPPGTRRATSSAQTPCSSAHRSPGQSRRRYRRSGLRRCPPTRCSASPSHCTAASGFSATAATASAAQPRFAAACGRVSSLRRRCRRRSAAPFARTGRSVATCRPPTTGRATSASSQPVSRPARSRCR